MIVPMKKFSLIILGDQKNIALTKLQKLGIAQIEISEGSGQKLDLLKGQISLLEKALFILEGAKCSEDREIGLPESLSVSQEVVNLYDGKKELTDRLLNLNAELDRLKKLGDFDPKVLEDLAKSGINLDLYEMPKSEYQNLGEDIKTLKVKALKSSVIFLLIKENSKETDTSFLDNYRIVLPDLSIKEIRENIDEISTEIKESEKKIVSLASCSKSIKTAVKSLEKDVEFETYATGMAMERLSSEENGKVTISYFKGFVEEENIDKLKQLAKENSWGILLDEPTPDDDVPTKLKNNKFVSLIYPLTDFLGTVPGYFEYDISGWFLAFILIFFGIIFGDGGYGLLICGVAMVPIISSLIKKKAVSPTFLLVGLFGLSTIVWGTLTCTWFGLSPEQLPEWLRNISLPIISNVYADKIWHPFWTQGDVGLTTAQNLQILCFSLALVQLTVAHIKGAIRNKKSVKLLGDVGSIFQLVGIFYLVLNLVVNSQVFGFGLILGGIPVGLVSICLLGIGFLLSFIFSNYEGNILKSILASCTDIVSVLLGVVNVFSDIVSYIRLWAVGLAGAAISATVNELAGPLLGNFMFMILAIILLVFGHGLNMILNILSVIVHGIRLNTLEFSSHLDMSWSGHKFKPFNDQID